MLLADWPCICYRAVEIPGIVRPRTIMTAMKKTTTMIKTIKSLAPATKSAPKSVGKAVAKTKTAASITPAVKSVAPKPVVTTITALINVGFGNALYIRGEGPGLSWDQGVLLECAADDKWTFALGESSRPIVFKLLINDQIWSIGDDYTVAPGNSMTVTPVF
jgi:hypothetical protein